MVRWGGPCPSAAAGIPHRVVGIAPCLGALSHDRDPFSSCEISWAVLDAHMASPLVDIGRTCIPTDSEYDAHRRI